MFVGLAGFSGLTGLTGFVAFVIDFTQLSLLVTHPAQTGEPYGSGQDELRICVITPVYPDEHDSVWLSVMVWQVGGFAAQVSE